MPAIRSAGIRGFREVVAELGGDPYLFARRAGLEPAALEEDDLLVEDEALARVLEIAAHTLGCPDLGLRIAARQDLSMLGPLALAIQHSPTLAAALECTSRYLFVHSRSLSVTLEPDPYGVRGVSGLRYGSAPGLRSPVQGTDLGLGFIHRAITALSGGPYGLRTVELPYSPAAPLTSYSDFFGVDVRVRRPAAMLRVPSSLGDLPLAGSNETVRRLAVDFLAEASADAGTSVVPRVRGAIQQTLGTRPPEIGPVADLIGVHPRTLQRRLAAEGTSFAEILDDVRRVSAQRYLTATDLPLGQVAGLLGLSEQSALSRCCRRWWDLTPSAVRRRPAEAGPAR